MYVSFPAVPGVGVPYGTPLGCDTHTPGVDPICPPICEPTVETMLLLSDAIPLSPDVTNVNTQLHRYVGYKILTVMNVKSWHEGR